MKRRNVVALGSIVVFIPVAYCGLIILSGFAVAAFFMNLARYLVLSTARGIQRVTPAYLQTIHQLLLMVGGNLICEIKSNLLGMGSLHRYMNAAIKETESLKRHVLHQSLFLQIENHQR